MVFIVGMAFVVLVAIGRCGGGGTVVLAIGMACGLAVAVAMAVRLGSALRAAAQDQRGGPRAPGQGDGKGHEGAARADRESTRPDSRHPVISYALFFLEKK